MMVKRNTSQIGHPCVYKIVNNINGKLYIGSAIGNFIRKSQHYYLLRRDKHPNAHLQSAWNIYGELNFSFIVIEFVSETDRLIKEQEYQDLYKSYIPEYGYNCKLKCSSSLGVKWSEEAKKKFSEFKKGKPTNLDYALIAKLNRKKVKAISKVTGEEFCFNSVKEASIVLNASRTSISKVLHGRTKSTKDYYWKFWDFTEKSVSNNPVNSEKALP